MYRSFIHGMKFLWSLLVSKLCSVNKIVLLLKRVVRSLFCRLLWVWLLVVSVGPKRMERGLSYQHTPNLVDILGKYWPWGQKSRSHNCTAVIAMHCDTTAFSHFQQLGHKLALLFNDKKLWLSGSQDLSTIPKNVITLKFLKIPWSKSSLFSTRTSLILLMFESFADYLQWFNASGYSIVT